MVENNVVPVLPDYVIRINASNFAESDKMWLLFAIQAVKAQLSGLDLVGLTHENERTRYNLNVLLPPFEVEFSQHEISISLDYFFIVGL